VSGTALAHGHHHRGTGGSGQAGIQSSGQQRDLTVTEEHRGPDDFVKQWKTQPGEQPQVTVTVERKGWEQWAQQQKQQMDQLRAERDQALQRAQLAELNSQNMKGVQVSQDQRGVVLTLNGSVLFAFNKSDLLPAAKTKLDQVAEVLKQSPDASFTVEGNTDSKGSADYNKELSERRANSVKDYLASKGVNGDNIKAVGNGEDQPVASNDTPEGRANNRRVEIILPQGAMGIGGAGSAGSSCDQNQNKQLEQNQQPNPEQQ
jgi:outer membrane protein OmpA-like peptidoglycan-associated protein